MYTDKNCIHLFNSILVCASARTQDKGHTCFWSSHFEGKLFWLIVLQAIFYRLSKLSVSSKLRCHNPPPSTLKKDNLKLSIIIIIFIISEDIFLWSVKFVCQYKRYSNVYSSFLPLMPISTVVKRLKIRVSRQTILPFKILGYC